MPMQSVAGFCIACETCGTTAIAALDQAAAIANAQAAGYIMFTVRDGAPKSGASVWACQTCMMAAAAAMTPTPPAPPPGT